MVRTRTQGRSSIRDRREYRRVAAFVPAAGSDRCRTIEMRRGVPSGSAPLALMVVLLQATLLSTVAHYQPLVPQPRWASRRRSTAHPATTSRSSAAECTDDWQSVDDPAVRACCRYRVERQPVTALRGEVPTFVNRTLYHAVFVTNLTDDFPGASTVGALLSVDFSTTPPLASFRHNEGTKFATMCNTTPPAIWAPSNAVTINRLNASALVVASAVPNVVNRFDAATLAPVATPFAIENEGGFPGPPQHRGEPEFYGPGHQPADHNGDVYGYVYLYQPTPGYELFVIPAGSDRRRRLAIVNASAEFGAHGAPAFSHQGLMLTPSYIILMEAPCLMPKQSVPFSYSAAGKGWMANSQTIFRVLDKTTGTELGSYSSPSAWFSWHHINSWENSTHITMDITWVPNGQSILKGMSGQLLPFDWEGKLVRLTIPNPRMSSDPMEEQDYTAVGSDQLKLEQEIQPQVRWQQFDGSPRWASPEFGVVNPHHMYQHGPTRFMWYLASNETTREQQFLPTVVKLDTFTNTTLSWYRPYAAPVSPIFVPRSATQGPDEDDGALIVLLIPSSDVPNASLGIPPRENKAVVL